MFRHMPPLPPFLIPEVLRPTPRASAFLHFFLLDSKNGTTTHLGLTESNVPLPLFYRVVMDSQWKTLDILQKDCVQFRQTLQLRCHKNAMELHKPCHAGGQTSIS